jgi:acyl carrier protein
MGTHHPLSPSGAFPAADIAVCIRTALDAEHAAQQVLRPHAASACEPEVDSLVVVEVICAIEETFGISLPESFAPRGGYIDVETCVSALMAETQAVWMESSKEVEAHHV